MSLTAGTRIGVFEIVEKIGEGGMGQVYRAHDTRLDRHVALKVLPDLFTNDPERLARFEREAKVLASLNHPHIAQVYGFELPSAGAPQAAIAMELVEGQTLQAVLEIQRADTASPGLPLDRTLAIVRQIAAALEAAHEQGIIHRDLKPANISIREDGTVKVLDFGLAKAFAADAESAQSAVAHSPTLTQRSTQLGLILGTAAYMSPEQARGRPVDRRADVWACGAVCFEMLAGRRAFEGDDISDVLAAVLKTEPDWSALPADLPPPVRRLLRRCLEKDPRKRLRDIAEGLLQLDEGIANGSMTSGMTAVNLPASHVGTDVRPLWRRAAPIVATAIATAVIVAAIGVWRRPPPAAPPLPARALFTPPASAPLFTTIVHRDLAISPDGRTVAYTGSAGNTPPALFIRRLDQLEPVPLRGAEMAVGPFYSHDGEWVGFIDPSTQEQIKKVSILGGPAATVTTAAGLIQGAAWLPDGIIFGVRGAPLQHVSDAGGPAVQLTALDTTAGETDHLWPAAVPGTRVVLFAAVSGDRGADLDMQLAAFDRATNRTVRLKLEGSSPRYLSSGHIVYATSDGSLRAVPFDPKTMSISGTPVPVLEGVGVKRAGGANFDVSVNGHLVHANTGSRGADRTITWVDRSGRETPIPIEPRTIFYGRVSPDGARISLDIRDNEQDVWVYDVKREDLARLTDKPGPDQYGLWTPDHRLIFSSVVSGRSELFRHRPDAVGQPEQITDTSADRLMPFPNAITPDGRQVIFRAAVGGTRNDLFVADIGGDKKVRPLLSSEHDERNAALSPDGAYIAFESDVTGGRFEVFVRPFPNVDDSQYKVSSDGGSEPVWARDGSEIYYINNGQLMAVPVTRAGGFELGKPVALFPVGQYFFGGAGRNYDVADGKRFLMIKRNSGEQRNQSLPITIVLNWIEELRARLR